MLIIHINICNRKYACVIDGSLRGLPPALIITNENDVLRDEGEAYAHKLISAGVKVAATRYVGAIHDLMLLNPITQTPPARAAIAQMTDTLRNVFAQGT